MIGATSREWMNGRRSSRYFGPINAQKDAGGPLHANLQDEPDDSFADASAQRAKVNEDD